MISGHCSLALLLEEYEMGEDFMMMMVTILEIIMKPNNKHRYTLIY